MFERLRRAVYDQSHLPQDALCPVLLGGNNTAYTLFDQMSSLPSNADCPEQASTNDRVVRHQVSEAAEIHHRSHCAD
ncbi:hypothetical protein MCOR14_006079 [Pyricularia oryzae]|nr:hypothetical protein MCOR19_008874 [Pyricularia oryzae]KAI6587111.1 hypothetical protein MCOR12_009628 [Pyricularia oryzae]KAI6593237.1 hypothetical protein MCOR06_003854 [Pyricularia oryzae]KAI6629714.1 hypothetical protein MCOR08_006376 [Pyricularia oryzae]KAI6634734.1 hypothetical protein MCOR14_006079 [Pyricularia oryzae]